jgi:DNA-binding PucR family transcriptional regulator
MLGAADILVPTEYPRSALSLDDELVAVIGPGGLGWAHALAAEMAREYVEDTVPELSRSADFTGGLRISAEANILALLRSLISGTLDARTPPEALDFIDEAVARQVPLVAMLRGHQIAVEHWLRWCAPAIASHTAADRQAAELELAVSVGVRHVDRISEQMVEEYEREMRRRTASGAARHAAVVGAVLAGDEIDVVEASRILNYPLRGSHIALALQVRADSQNQVDVLEAEARSFARRVGATGLLTNATGLSTLDAWVATNDDIKRPVEPVGERIDIGVGTSCTGVSGFVRSNREAHKALEIHHAAVPGRFDPIIYYDRVRLLSLVINDVPSISAFVFDTLGGLAGTGDRARELRETLLAFFEADKSYTAVSRLLHMHKNTVIRRVAKANELAGRDLTTGIDGHVALLLTDALGVEDFASSAKPEK